MKTKYVPTHLSVRVSPDWGEEQDRYKLVVYSGALLPPCHSRSERLGFMCCCKTLYLTRCATLPNRDGLPRATNPLYLGTNGPTYLALEALSRSLGLVWFSFLSLLNICSCYLVVPFLFLGG